MARFLALYPKYPPLYSAEKSSKKIGMFAAAHKLFHAFPN